MKVKRKTVLALTLSLVMCSGMLAGSAVTSMAATIHGDGTTDATAALTKNFAVPTGVTKPAANFNFTYTKDGVVTGSSAYNSTVTADSTQPNLTALDGSTDITYAASMTKTGTVGGKDIYVKTIANVVPSASSFAHAGEYVYTIKEQASTNSSIDAAMTYSGAEYKMHVFVKNTSDGLVVSGVAAYQTKNDAGQTGTNAKVDLDTNSLIAGTGNDFAFTNTYAPLSEALVISKTVSGDYADLTQVWTESITVTNPSNVTGNTEYKAVIVDSTSKKPVSTTVYTITAGTAKAIELKNGQELIFVKSDYTADTSTAVTEAQTAVLPAGLKYSVTESGKTDYISKAVVTHGGTTDGQLTAASGQNLTVSTNTIVDVGSNGTALESVYHDVTITGIIINLMPAIMLIIFAAIGIIINLDSSRRRNAQ